MARDTRITYADLYQLAGVIAVEVTGGPVIDFSSGRKDSKISPTEGRLPDAKRGAPHLREKFCRMGLSNQNIVALSRDYTGNSSTLFVSIYGLLWYWIDTFSLHRLLWSYREGHIQIDLVLIVRGLRNLCSL
ncbi:hypothetical protein ACFXTH_035122 [Malus domestica]